ncbi:MAG: hypothetical protein KAU20_00380 [Nanoarchaeota archaeon]|nr:hypothetical protein [Nanoarchaeota archaeon]
MAAWASVLADSFDCIGCKRSLSCPMKSHIDEEESLELIAEAELPKMMPLIFKAEAVGICPRVFMGQFSLHVMKCHSWWEKGQLGVDLLQAPAWVDSAFNILSSERMKARIHLMRK